MEHTRITPPMTSAGMVACELFLRERGLTVPRDYDEMVRVIYGAMSEESQTSKKSLARSPFTRAMSSAMAKIWGMLSRSENQYFSGAAREK